MKKKLILLYLFIFSLSLFAQQEQVRRDITQEKLDSIDVKKWKVIGKLGFIFNQYAFSNWLAGGENSVAGTITLNYDFNYVLGLWKWDNKIIASYGSSYFSDNGYRKTDDRFGYNSTLARKSIGKWYLSYYTNLTTQFSNGYDYSKDPKELVSGAFAPTYFSTGPGFLWRKSDNLRFNLAPATSKITFVGSKFSGEFGVPEGRKTLYGLGFNFIGYLKFNVLENISMENIINIYMDYLNEPENLYLNYQINFQASINKNLMTNLTIHIISDDNASSTLQFREVFGLGINYIFHNKELIL